jgi:uncharacterized membrane protein
MNKYYKWLQDEIESWRRENLITTEQARLLQERYSGQETEDGWGKVVLSAVGAIIFGLGVILFFAYNWQDMHRLTKLASVLLALLLAHGAAWRLGRDGGANKKLGESLYLLGTMLFGAGIWLVAQIYHIDEHYPNGILVWSLGALAFAWILPSVAHGLLALSLIGLWTGFEIFDFDKANHWGFWLLTLAVIPLAWLQRSRVLLFFGLAAAVLLYAFTCTHLLHDIIISGLFIFSCAQLLAARFAPASSFPGSGGVLQTTGYPVYLSILYAATFGNLKDQLILHIPPGHTLAWLYWLLPLLATGLALVVLLTRYRHLLEDPVERTETGLLLAALIVFIGSCFAVAQLYLWGWLLFNLIFLGHGVIFVLRGIQLLRWKQVALGSLMLAALVVARFLDLFDSLLLRSLVFLILGAGLFYIGHLYARQKQERRHA